MRSSVDILTPESEASNENKSDELRAIASE